MNITYEKVQKRVGKERADEVLHEICLIHKGATLGDVRSMVGGLDISGCSDDDKARIEVLLSEKPKKDGK